MTSKLDRIQENASRYIVKNCPCIKHYDDIELDNRCMGNEHIPFFCENNPDCVIKRVIEKCNIYKNFTAITINDYAKRELALHILDLFDIEEINK